MTSETFREIGTKIKLVKDAAVCTQAHTCSTHTSRQIPILTVTHANAHTKRLRQRAHACKLQT